MSPKGYAVLDDSRSMRLARDSRDAVSFIAQLHLLAIDDALTGAILELMSMR